MTVDTRSLPITEASLRILYPFFLQGPHLQDDTRQVSDALESLIVQSARGKAFRVWERAQLGGEGAGETHGDVSVARTGTDRAQEERARVGPHRLYVAEILEPVQRLLFGSDQGSCAYYRVAPQAVDWLFHQNAAHGASTPALPDDVRAALPPDCSPREMLTLVRPKKGEVVHSLHTFGNHPGIELWVSPHGVGILSLTLTLNEVGLTVETIEETVYRLSQAHGDDQVPRLCFGMRVQTLTPDERKAAATGSFDERLRAQTGWFSLPELRDWLLGPLTAPGRDLRVIPSAEQFPVFSVVRFGPAVDLCDPATRAALQRPLARLAQLEESSHPGAADGDMPVPHALLNRSVLAAVSHLGAVRFLTDQQGQTEFNRDRLRRSRDKAFVPFLLALLQRLVLERIRRSVASAVRGARGKDLLKVRAGFAADRRDLLEFGTTAFFTEASTRDEYNRYFHLAQQGQRVRDAYQEGTRAIAELDHACTVEEQARTARESVGLQVRLEWVEIFLVSFYAFHFAGIVGEHFHFDSQYIGWSAIGMGVLAAGVALVGLTPWKHDGHHPAPQAERHSGSAQRWALALVPFVAGAVYIATGFLAFSHSVAAVPNQPLPTATAPGEGSATGTSGAVPASGAPYVPGPPPGGAQVKVDTSRLPRP